LTRIFTSTIKISLETYATYSTIKLFAERISLPWNDTLSSTNTISWITWFACSISLKIFTQRIYWSAKSSWTNKISIWTKWTNIILIFCTIRISCWITWYSWYVDYINRWSWRWRSWIVRLIPNTLSICKCIIWNTFNTNSI